MLSRFQRFGSCHQAFRRPVPFRSAAITCSRYIRIGAEVVPAVESAGRIHSGTRVPAMSFDLGVLAGLGCIIAGSFAVSKSDWAREHEHEAVWFGRRGLGGDRSVALLPLLTCLASGVLATFLVVRFPTQTISWNFGSQVHEVLALPLAILVAFRFDNSYQRWWTSREEIETLSAGISNFALIATVSQCQGQVARGTQQKSKENKQLINDLLVQLCESIAEKLHQKARFEDKGIDPVLKGIEALMLAVQTGRELEQFNPEVAAQLITLLCEMRKCYGFCTMVNTQDSPASFVIHMRSFLLLFCITFPFTILHIVSFYMIIPVQAIVSLGLLGIEFCSREMEHPFGDDPSDIPVRKIMDEVRGQIVSMTQGPALH